MPVGTFWLSQSQFDFLGPDARNRLGHTLREVIPELAKVSIDEVAIYWLTYADAQNPLTGPEFWLFFSTRGKFQDDEIDVVVQKMRVELAKAIWLTGILKDFSESGVWPLPNQHARFGFFNPQDPNPPTTFVSDE